MWGPLPHAPTPHAARFQLAMADIQIKKTGEEPGAASLVVTVPPEHVREAEERATADYQRRARLPGFRRGEAQGQGPGPGDDRDGRGGPGEGPPALPAGAG